MSSLTTNLKLVKPELQDNITPTIFADNFDKIDAALEGVSGGALSLEEIEASTNLDGKIPSAAALKEVNDSFVSNIYVGNDGKLHKVQGGADSVLPFSSIKRYSYSWTSSNNEQKTLTLEIEPKYIAFTVGGNKQNAVLYDVENKEYIINTTGVNIIVSVNGKVLTINTYHGASQVNYLNYW